jgi:uncharacterized protein YkwD
LNAQRTNDVVITSDLDEFAESRLPGVRASFNHDGFRAKAGTMRYAFLGEILARHVCGDALINAWLESPKHKEVMLDERYDFAGIAGDKTFTIVIFGYK